MYMYIYIKKLFFGQLSISMYHACRSVVNPPDCCSFLVYLAASKLKTTTTTTTTFAVYIAHEGFRVNMLKSYITLNAHVYTSLTEDTEMNKLYIIIIVVACDFYILFFFPKR